MVYLENFPCSFRVLKMSLQEIDLGLCGLVASNRIVSSIYRCVLQQQSALVGSGAQETCQLIFIKETIRVYHDETSIPVGSDQIVRIVWKPLCALEDEAHEQQTKY